MKPIYLWLLVTAMLTSTNYVNSQLNFVEDFQIEKFSELEEIVQNKSQLIFARKFYNPPKTKYSLEVYNKDLSKQEIIEIDEILGNGREYLNSYFLNDKYFIVCQKREKGYNKIVELSLVHFDLKTKTIKKELPIEFMKNATNNHRCDMIELQVNKDNNMVGIGLLYSEGILKQTSGRIQFLIIDDEGNTKYEKNIPCDVNGKTFDVSKIEVSNEGFCVASGFYYKSDDKNEYSLIKYGKGKSNAGLKVIGPEFSIEEEITLEKNLINTISSYIDKSEIYLYGLSTENEEKKGRDMFIYSFDLQTKKLKKIVEHKYADQLIKKFLSAPHVKGIVEKGTDKIEQISIYYPKNILFSIHENSIVYVFKAGCTYVNQVNKNSGEVKVSKLAMSESDPIFPNQPIVFLKNGKINVLYNDNINNHEEIDLKKGALYATYGGKDGLITLAKIEDSGSVELFKYHLQSESKWNIHGGPHFYEKEGDIIPVFELIQAPGKYRIALFK